jgi:hypothetical protein
LLPFLQLWSGGFKDRLPFLLLCLHTRVRIGGPAALLNPILFSLYNMQDNNDLEFPVWQPARSIPTPFLPSPPGKSWRIFDHDKDVLMSPQLLY